MAMWVIPGCPLEGGRGWRIWLSREGTAEFTPGTIEVTNQAGQPQESTTGWMLLAPLRGLDRRIGVATITLASPRPGANYCRQYDRLWTVLERAARGQGADGKPHDILILAGDIHTSRYCEATLDGLTVREFVSSPVSKICPDRTTPEEPPDRIAVGEGTGRRTWTVRRIGEPTLDSTVGLVRMTEGLGGKVVMELALWRLRPYPRDWIGRMRRCLGLGAPQGEFRFIFTHRVELR